MAPSRPSPPRTLTVRAMFSEKVRGRGAWTSSAGASSDTSGRVLGTLISNLLFWSFNWQQRESGDRGRGAPGPRRASPERALRGEFDWRGEAAGIGPRAVQRKQSK